jgi:oligopeptide/dipeptide ABC transporter ATP-binding protein
MGTLLEVKNLQKYFPATRNMLGKPDSFVHAVDGVSFTLEKGRVLGVVGESGCGKSTIGRVILRIYEPDSGQILYGGTDMTHLRGNALRAVRRNMQMVFQDPCSSMDPSMKAGEIISEGLHSYRMTKNPAETRERVASLMAQCELSPSQIAMYPHQFSGGQRQRICIARALATNPEFIVCDEAVSSLDVSIQSQVINLFKDLQDKHNLTYLFISHDLNVIRFISNDVLVMYLGQIVESGPTDEIYSHSAHPYTRALLSACPVFTDEERAARKRILLTGDIASPVDPKPGCRFAPRCPYAEERCRKVEPENRAMGPGHFAKCHLV